LWGVEKGRSRQVLRQGEDGKKEMSKCAQLKGALQRYSDGPMQRKGGTRKKSNITSDDLA